MGIALRYLQQPDLPLLLEWLNKPHMRPFYMQETISAEEVESKFTPRLDGGDAVTSVLAMEDDRPFGHMQWYLNRSFPDYGAAVIGMEQGVSIDYYIGDPVFLGRSLGSKMLSALVEQTAPKLDQPDRLFCIAHADENHRAIRCSKGAGFTEHKWFEEKGIASTLFIRDERDS